MTDLLLASQNPGKLGEMRLLVEGLPFRVLGPRDIGLLEAPDETGTTFLENATHQGARIRAALRASSRVADDSGLSVDALGGAPGLYSSRFGGEGASDLERNRLLLEKLRDVPRERAAPASRARLPWRAGTRCSSRRRRVVEGRIAEEMRGGNGFGYDPLFFYPPFGRTFGEVHAAGEGPRQPPRQGLRPPAGVPRRDGWRPAGWSARRRSASARRSRPSGLGLGRRGPSLELDRSLMPLSAAAMSAAQLFLGEGAALGGALDLDEVAAAGLDDVHVHVRRSSPPRS